jgi:hypothetical protein
LKENESAQQPFAADASPVQEVQHAAGARLLLLAVSRVCRRLPVANRQKSGETRQEAAIALLSVDDAPAASVLIFIVMYVQYLSFFERWGVKSIMSVN